MDTGAALLASIVSAPSDDTPRLVFADWLQENGQEPRAEFIRIQCELARTCASCHGQRRVFLHGPYDPGGADVGTSWYVEPCPECVHPDDVHDVETTPVDTVLEAIRKSSDHASELRTRTERLLLENESVWRRGPPCPACRGTTRVTRQDYKEFSGPHPVVCKCPKCDGTGDAGGLLARRFFYRPPWFEPEDGLIGVDLREPVRVTFDRGFVSGITVPRLTDLYEPCPDCTDGRWRNGSDGACRTCDDHRARPSAWLRGVLTAAPERALIRSAKSTDVTNYLELRDGAWWVRDTGVYDHDPRVPAAFCPLDVFPSAEAAAARLAERVVKWARTFRGPENRTRSTT